MRRRAFRIGTQDADGLVPISGRLLPEIGGALAGLLEAYRRSPRFVDSGVGLDPDVLEVDPRTPDHRRHDMFAEIVGAAAAAADAPTLDGQTVAVVVTVAAEDLNDPEGLSGHPIGTMTGSSIPVSRAQVERFIDAGGYRTVRMDQNGAVSGISSLQRCFTAAQRLAIAARDGYRCASPGCTTPHYSLQVHHVTPWRDGGPTTTGNGILLCYWHHRRVDDGPWRHRMTNGIPEVRGPGLPEWTRLNPRIGRVAVA